MITVVYQRSATMIEEQPCSSTYYSIVVYSTKISSLYPHNRINIISIEICCAYSYDVMYII